jgi:hypothetical protein
MGIGRWIQIKDVKQTIESIEKLPVDAMADLREAIRFMAN